MKLPATACMLLAGACSDAIEMKLQLPPSAVASSYDLSCVTGFEFVAIGHFLGNEQQPPDVMSTCLDLAHAPASYAELHDMIAGQVDLPMPSTGLAGVDFRGFSGSCSDKIPGHEALFYGGAPYVDGFDLSVPLVPNISCNPRKDYTVRLVDLMKPGTCAPVQLASGGGGVVFASDIRPMLYSKAMPGVSTAELDFGVSAIAPAADATGKVTSYAQAAPGGCISVGAEGQLMAVGCVDASAPTLCATSGQVELPVIDDVYSAISIDGKLAAQFGEPVFGAVWHGGTAKAAIPGATVTLDDPTLGTVVYVDPAADRLAPNGGVSTSASGMFIVYTKGMVGVTVAAPGFKSQHYTVAGVPELPATLLAVLAP